MKWMVPEHRLDADQRYFINTFSKEAQRNVWIKGHAGSGKSILLGHTLRDRLIENPKLKVAIVVYTHALIDLLRQGIRELNIETDLGISIPIHTYPHFMKTAENYDMIFCDEVQDLPQSVLDAIRKRAKKAFVAGDSNQSIYDFVPGTGEPVVNPDKIGVILEADDYEMQTIYRLTSSIIQMVSNVFKDILRSRRDATKKNVEIKIGKAKNYNEEIRYIWKEAQKAVTVGDSTVILFPRHDNIVGFCNSILELEGKPKWDIQRNEFSNYDYNSLNEYLQANYVDLEYIGNSIGNLGNVERKHKIIIMTYNSVKGLDFENVFMPDLSSSWYTGSRKPYVLFMVALTRSRNNLFLTYSGTKHEIFDRFTPGYKEFNIHEEEKSNSDFNEF